MNPKILDKVPWNAVMPAGPQTVLILLSVVIGVFALWFLVAETRRRKDYVPLYAMLGGALAVMYEPLGDTLVCAFYPMHGQIKWITLFGRSVPLFIGVLYFWYMSVPAIYFLRKLEKGLARSSLWAHFCLLVAICIGIEMYGVSRHAWMYYGTQAYTVLGVPLWAPFTYVGFTLVFCIGLQLMSTSLNRRRHWLIVPAMPMLLGGGHMAVTLPAAAAVFSTSNLFWLWFGATITIALSIGLAWTMSLVYCSDSRFRVFAKTC